MREGKNLVKTLSFFFRLPTAEGLFVTRKLRLVVEALMKVRKRRTGHDVTENEEKKNQRTVKANFGNGCFFSCSEETRQNWVDPPKR